VCFILTFAVIGAAALAASAKAKAARETRWEVALVTWVFWLLFVGVSLADPRTLWNFAHNSLLLRAVSWEFAVATLVAALIATIAWYLSESLPTASEGRSRWSVGLSLVLSVLAAVGLGRFDSEPWLLAGATLVLGWVVGRRAPVWGWWLLTAWAVLLAAYARLRIDSTRSLSFGWGLGLATLAGVTLQLRLVLGPERTTLRRTSLMVPLIPIVLMVAHAVPGPSSGPDNPRDHGSSPNVVVVVIDTLRADHTGLGGYARNTTPTLDRLGFESTVFAAACSPATATVPSLKAIFTGRRASRLGGAALFDPPLAGSRTLAMALREKGYRTGAFAANGSISGPGFEGGFDTFRSFQAFGFAQQSPLIGGLMCRGDFFCALRLMDRWHFFKSAGREVVSAAGEWLRAVDHAGPFFLYLHLLEPHWPYYDHQHGLIPPRLRVASPISHVDLLNAMARGQDLSRWKNSPSLEELIARYDEGIREADDVLRTFLEELRDRGHLDDTILVVLGDHGEEFLEHGGFSHGHDVYPELSHVPFLVRFPRGRGFPVPRRIDRPVSAGSLHSTLAEYLGLKSPEPSDFKSLVGTISDTADTMSIDPVVTEALHGKQYVLGVRVGDRLGRVEWALGTRFGADEFHVPTGALIERPSQLAEDTSGMARTIAAGWPGSSEPTEAAERDNLEQLRALGYIR
jgi:arylsulfatase